MNHQPCSDLLNCSDTCIRHWTRAAWDGRVHTYWCQDSLRGYPWPLRPSSCFIKKELVGLYTRWCHSIQVCIHQHFGEQSIHLRRRWLPKRTDSILGTVSPSQQLTARKLTSICIFFPNTHSKKVFSKVWKWVSVWSLLSWCSSQKSWSPEQDEMSSDTVGNCYPEPTCAGPCRSSWSQGRGPPGLLCPDIIPVLSQNWHRSKPQPQLQFLGGSGSSRAEPHFQHVVSC